MVVLLSERNWHRQDRAASSMFRFGYSASTQESTFRKTLSRPLVDKTKDKLMKVIMPKHVQIKNDTRKLSEPNLQKMLTALCNAGVSVGPRGIRELLRPCKVSMPKGRGFEGIERSWLCLQRAAKTAAWS
jgi:hypothetical protein